MAETNPAPAETNPAPAEEKRTYRGNCHCGAFVFEAFIPEIKEVKVCNCSICIKKNYAFAVVPDADFKVVKGDIEKDLTIYKFEPGLLSHMFCSNCGTAVLGTYTKMPGFTAINARAVQGPLDLWKMAKNKYDGISYKPEYVPPSYDDMPEPVRRFDDEPSGGKLYHGSCHCGDVRVALRVAEPFGQTPAADFHTDPARAIVECNCSLCQRVGATWIYPNRDQVVIKVAGGGDNPRGDAYSKAVGAYHVRMGSQVFCRRCGVFVANRLDIQTDEEFNALPEKVRGFIANKRDWQPLNLRIFPDVELSGLNITEADGWNRIQPPYVNP